MNHADSTVPRPDRLGIGLYIRSADNGSGSTSGAHQTAECRAFHDINNLQAFGDRGPASRRPPIENAAPRTLEYR
jgi:hypothetical protein